MSNIIIKELFYKRVVSEVSSHRWTIYTLIITCLMLIETIVVALSVSNDLIVALVAAFGLFVIWGFIQLQVKKLEKELIADEMNNYTKLLSFQSNNQEYTGSISSTPINLALSERELQVLQCIASGSSNKQIAISLNISQQTVKNHLKHIFTKMEVKDRTSAALLAIRNGWINDQTIKSSKLF
jgi:DNA-binding CsgD family transcriptional regulator